MWQWRLERWRGVSIQHHTTQNYFPMNALVQVKKKKKKVKHSKQSRAKLRAQQTA